MYGDILKELGDLNQDLFKVEQMIDSGRKDLAKIEESVKNSSEGIEARQKELSECKMSKMPSLTAYRALQDVCKALERQSTQSKALRGVYQSKIKELEAKQRFLQDRIALISRSLEKSNVLQFGRQSCSMN